MLGEFVTARQCAEWKDRAHRSAARWIETDAAAWAGDYNRRPFPIRHRLADHPLLGFDALCALCRRLPPDDVKLRTGIVPIDVDFNSSLDGRHQQGLILDDALANLQARQAYVAIYNPERDPAYRPLFETLVGEIALLTERLDSAITWHSSYIFLSAQASVTPYHMDREMNFLMQVRGTKTVRLWDPFDDEVMTPEQKDRLLADLGAARPGYQPALESKAMRFELAPGMGVHHPFIAPHLVHTGPDLSITVAVTYRTRTSDVWSDAHRFNARLRRLGLHPGPVRRRPLVDLAKADMLRAIRGARRVIHRGESMAG